jgi:Spy/CpxP family protein refolding chaperone
MKFKDLALAASAALLLSGAGMAVAQEGGWHHGGGEGMELLHGVSLTDAQRDQVHSIEKTGRTQMKPLMRQMFKIHEQISSDLLAGATAEQLTSLMQQEESLRNQMDAERLALAVQVRGVLTPDQLTQAATQHAKLAALHQEEHALMSTGEAAPAQ